jgi:hypothetical protein
MLQELGAFILAGAKGPEDVKKMADMICDSRGWRWVGVYKHSRQELGIFAGSGTSHRATSVSLPRRGFAVPRSNRGRRIV